MIYLDPDTLILNPISPLERLDLEGNLFAAAAHTAFSQLTDPVNRVRLHSDSPINGYFNSGVLVMDLAAQRRELDPEDIFRYAADHAAELILPDQDLLNALYGSRVLPLDDSVYNYDASSISPVPAAQRRGKNDGMGHGPHRGAPLLRALQTLEAERPRALWSPSISTMPTWPAAAPLPPAGVTGIHRRKKTEAVLQPLFLWIRMVGVQKVNQSSSRTSSPSTLSPSADWISAAAGAAGFLMSSTLMAPFL